MALELGLELALELDDWCPAQLASRSGSSYLLRHGLWLATSSSGYIIRFSERHMYDLNIYKFRCSCITSLPYNSTYSSTEKQVFFI